jgi:hypothetical protein
MADLEMDLTDDKINNLETSGSNMYGASDSVGFIFYINSIFNVCFVEIRFHVINLLFYIHFYIT